MYHAKSMQMRCPLVQPTPKAPSPRPGREVWGSRDHLLNVGLCAKSAGLLVLSTCQTVISGPAPGGAAACGDVTSCEGSHSTDTSVNIPVLTICAYGIHGAVYDIHGPVYVIYGGVSIVYAKVNIPVLFHSTYCTLARRLNTERDNRDNIC